MEVRTSARRHGIADPDIHHAIDSAVAAGPVETNVDQIDGVLHIGPDRTGGLLEVITVEDVDDDEVAIHAMKLRTSAEVTDELAERLADDAEAGYAPRNVHVRPKGRGRPRLAKGEGPSPTVNARLDDDLADLLELRADRDGVNKSDVVREALRAYLA